jgi:hypothetical protein
MSRFSATAFRSEFGGQTSQSEPIEAIPLMTAPDGRKSSRPPTNWWQRLRPKMHDAAVFNAPSTHLIGTRNDVAQRH